MNKIFFAGALSLVVALLASIATPASSAQTVRLGPPLQDFGVGNPNTCIVMYDTAVNTGNVPFAFRSIKLVLGDQGFTIDSALPVSPLPVGSSSLIRICFKSIKGSTVFDTLRLDDGTVVHDVILTGTGGAPDFRITGHDWSAQLRGTDSIWDGTKGLAIEVVNSSPNQPIAIDSMWVDDPVHFVPTMDSHWATPINPVVISGKGIDVVAFTFHTSPSDSVGPLRTLWHARSYQLAGGNETGVRSNLLTGNVVASSQTFAADTTVTIDCPTGPENDSVHLEFVITATGTASSLISKVTHSSPVVIGFTVTRDNGSLVANPSNMSENLNPGSHLFITESLGAPLDADTTFTDTVWAYYIDLADGTTKLIGGRPLIATVIVTKCDAGVEQTAFVTPPSNILLVPNPANDFATISYTLKAAAEVKLELLSIVGSTVYRDESHEDAGEHARMMDLHALPNGSYVYRLEANGEVQSGALMIQR
ncbi:MAG: T9SS type A sorting domain-containing protein [Bacteroidota bacterium]|nr:T9SS type A sorting domain-containing protein [Bacteroidota bacterium]MDP4231858.1 T9SS type A sorting domain-containing protein [Bacteroidota bacterium]MDP4242744.1 T9SS type A sorting domain-containing protein [Bacteroidota bacterium]MDP4287195.1 T9SS type A sorting domain-containing protein [Bacteroidota bacterium]